MTTINVADWRTLADKLTPEQVRHLEADERSATDALNSSEAHTRATGQEMLDGLHAEAQSYANRNAPVWIEAPEAVDQFRTLLHSISVEPGTLDNADALALIELLWSIKLDRQAVLDLIDILENSMTQLGMRTT